MDYIIRDEDGERSWMRQSLWSEFGKKLAYEVVSDGKVLLAGDDDYLFLVLARGVEIMSEAKSRSWATLEGKLRSNHKSTNTDIERRLIAAVSGVRD